MLDLVIGKTKALLKTGTDDGTGASTSAGFYEIKLYVSAAIDYSKFFSNNDFNT